MNYVSEALGTFFLMFTIAVIIIGPGHASIGFVLFGIGIVLAALIYAYGHISDGYYNPAISLAIFMRGRNTVGDMLIYWAAQILGAVIAVYLVLYLKGPAPEIPTVSPGTIKTFLAEFIITFALSYTMVSVVITKDSRGNSFYDWAVSVAVMTGAYSVGVVSSSAFNPAVAIGLTLAGITPWSGIWVYLVANLAGGAAAAMVFKAVHPGRQEKKAAEE